ncbi:hypothetical protein [Sporichthya sp.]|uniref:hypothetical protein n=1 Tax=Sporichthya sp. TaxID=65475 RepID=UPI001803C82C|nr:hypothetical protein [Sporichthya sp.]MBA3745327.1 hypothetical protein [Sporichthya sp.]
MAETMPWLVQLGKGRAGWYFPSWFERLLPPKNRAIRMIDPRWQGLTVGDMVPDYGKDETLALVSRDPDTLVYESWRKHMQVTWVLMLRPVRARDGREGTRVHLRLRLGPVKHPRLVGIYGDLFDYLTILGMAAGLRERVREAGRPVG